MAVRTAAEIKETELGETQFGGDAVHKDRFSLPMREASMTGKRFGIQPGELDVDQGLQTGY